MQHFSIFPLWETVRRCCLFLIPSFITFKRSNHGNNTIHNNESNNHNQNHLSKVKNCSYEKLQSPVIIIINIHYTHRYFGMEFFLFFATSFYLTLVLRYFFSQPQFRSIVELFTSRGCPCQVYIMAN